MALVRPRVERSRASRSARFCSRKPRRTRAHAFDLRPLARAPLRRMDGWMDTPDGRLNNERRASERASEQLREKAAFTGRDTRDSHNGRSPDGGFLSGEKSLVVEFAAALRIVIGAGGIVWQIGGRRAMQNGRGPKFTFVRVGQLFDKTSQQVPPWRPEACGQKVVQSSVRRPPSVCSGAHGRPACLRLQAEDRRAPPRPWLSTSCQTQFVLLLARCVSPAASVSSLASFE